jgi:hypothetical protein
MTHTIRAYNKWARRVFHPYKYFSHPWKQICMGKCHHCRADEDDYQLTRKRNHILLKTKKFDILGEDIPEESTQTIAEILDEQDWS